MLYMIENEWMCGQDVILFTSFSWHMEIVMSEKNPLCKFLFAGVNCWFDAADHMKYLNWLQI